MRNDEVFRLRVEHINWQNFSYHNPNGKTKRAKRCVPLSDRVKNILLARSAGRKEGWVFPSRRAASGHLTTINKAFELARRKAGLPKGIVPYSARHTFGTRVYEATGNLAALMEVMGHAHVSTAMRYQHPGLEQIRAAVNAARTSQNTAQTVQ